MIRLRKHLEYEIATDLYAARVRGRHPELVVNHGYDGVLALNCLHHQVHANLAFPDKDFPIYSWIMTPTGDISYVFSEEEEHGALRIDHEQATVTSMTLPSGLPVISELAWFFSPPVLLDYSGNLWVIDGISMRLASAEEAERCMFYFWRRVLSHYVVVKTDPYERGVYVRSKDFEHNTIGFMPFDDRRAPQLAADDGSAVDTARFGDTLFVSFEKQVVVAEGEISQPLLAAGDDELIVRINVVEDGAMGYLTVLRSAENHGRPKGWVTIYQILTS